MMHQTRVIKIPGCLKDGKCATEMMDSEFRVAISQCRQAPDTLYIAKNKKIGRRITFLNYQQRIFALVDLTLLEVAFGEDKSRHFGVVFVTDLSRFGNGLAGLGDGPVEVTLC